MFFCFSFHLLYLHFALHLKYILFFLTGLLLLFFFFWCITRNVCCVFCARTWRVVITIFTILKEYLFTAMLYSSLYLFIYFSCLFFLYFFALPHFATLLSFKSSLFEGYLLRWADLSFPQWGSEIAGRRWFTRKRFSPTVVRQLSRKLRKFG